MLFKLNIISRYLNAVSADETGFIKYFKTDVILITNTF